MRIKKIMTWKDVKKNMKSEDGASVVVVALSLVFLLSIVALVVDLGSAFTVKADMQAASDLAALSAAKKLTGDPSCATAVENAAKDYAKANGYEGCDVVDVKIYDNYTKVKVTIKQNKPTFFARVLGVNDMDVGTKAVAGKNSTSSGVVGGEYAFFSASDTIPVKVKASFGIYSTKGTHTNANFQFLEGGGGDIAFHGIYGSPGGSVSYLKDNVTTNGIINYSDGSTGEKITQKISVPNYHDSIMSRVPSDAEYVGTYETLDQYFAIKGSSGYNLSEKIKVKKLTSSGTFDHDLSLGSGASLKIIGDSSSTEQTDIFGKSVTLADDSSLYSECGSVEIKGQLSVGEAYVVVRDNLTLGASTPLIRNTAWGVGAIYVQYGNFTFPWGSGGTTFAGLIYVPRGQLDISNYSLNVTGSVVVDSLKMYTDTYGSVGGSLNINEAVYIFGKYTEYFKPASTPLENTSEGGGSVTGKVRLVE